MFVFDPLYMLVMLVSLALSLWASAKVKTAFAHYRKIPAASALTGAEVAQRILDKEGVQAHVRPLGRQNLLFGSNGGELADHYDTRDRTVRLSPQVYHGTSVAAQAIAAHEVGHALQHAQRYMPLFLRNAIAPAAALGSKVSYFLIIIGFLMHLFSFVKLGILFFAVVVAFQVITLPVELDASRRAKELLQGTGLAVAEEGKGVAAVLDAAALTYVAAAAAAVLNLAYLLLRSRD